MIEGNFSGLEIIKMAISMEEEGMAYYTNGAKYTDSELKDFLLQAAAQEKIHKEKFLTLYNNLAEKKENMEEDYLFDSDVSAYLKALVENQVFDKKAQPEDAFKDIKSAAANALKAEETTVALYSKMLEGAKYNDMKEMLSILIAEEKAHVLYFENILKSI